MPDIEHAPWPGEPPGPYTISFRKKCDEFVALDTERAPIEEARAKCLAADDAEGAAAYAARLTEIENRLLDIGIALHGTPNRPQIGLRYLSNIERRTQLLAKLAASNLRVQENGVRIRTQQKLIEAKELELKDEYRKLQKLNADGCGHYEAQLTLKKHRDQFPDIPESEALNA